MSILENVVHPLLHNIEEKTQSGSTMICLVAGI
jgi:hypothetical protein